MMMRHFVLLAILAIGACAIGGCEDSSGEPDAPSQALLGRWTLNASLSIDVQNTSGTVDINGTAEFSTSDGLNPDQVMMHLVQESEFTFLCGTEYRGMLTLSPNGNWTGTMMIADEDPGAALENLQLSTILTPTGNPNTWRAHFEFDDSRSTGGEICRTGPKDGINGQLRRE